MVTLARLRHTFNDTPPAHALQIFYPASHHCMVFSAGSPLPPASLKLLVPPVRLMSAFMWKVVQRDGSVMQYDKLLDFISLVTEMVPELLSPRQKAELMLGLRAKVRLFIPTWCIH